MEEVPLVPLKDPVPLVISLETFEIIEFRADPLDLPGCELGAGFGPVEQFRRPDLGIR